MSATMDVESEAGHRHGDSDTELHQFFYSLIVLCISSTSHHPVRRTQPHECRGVLVALSNVTL